jgi:hypothetical protein
MSNSRGPRTARPHRSLREAASRLIAILVARHQGGSDLRHGWSPQCGRRSCSARRRMNSPRTNSLQETLLLIEDCHPRSHGHVRVGAAEPSDPPTLLRSGLTDTHLHPGSGVVAADRHPRSLLTDKATPALTVTTQYRPARGAAAGPTASGGVPLGVVSVGAADRPTRRSLGSRRGRCQVRPPRRPGRSPPGRAGRAVWSSWCGG